MNFVYRLEGVEFEWDRNKAESNLVKHGVTFEEAAKVFFDPFAQEGDARVDLNNVILFWVTHFLKVYC